VISWLEAKAPLSQKIILYILHIFIHEKQYAITNVTIYERNYQTSVYDAGISSNTSVLLPSAVSSTVATSKDYTLIRYEI